MVGPAEVLALQRIDGIAAAAAAIRLDATLTRQADVRQITGYGVSEGFFELFGVPLTIGRGFSHEEYVSPRPGVVVLSHRLWMAAFGGNTDVVGERVVVGGLPVTVVGVAGPAMDRPEGADLWYNRALSNDDVSHLFDGYIRLKPGVSLASLRDQLTAAMTELGQRFPDQNKGRAYVMRPLLEQTVGEVAPVLWIVFGATGLLLLLATFNVANLTLARDAAAARDVAVRLALGASPRRIIHDHLVEAVVVSVVAGIVGTAAAFAFLKLTLRFGAARIARMDTVHLDPAVLGFVLLAVVLATVIPGLLPALRSAAMDSAAILNEGGRTLTASVRARRTLRLFTIVQIAVSVALVAGAIRLIRSYDNLQRVDLGFQRGGQLVIDVMRTFNPDRPVDRQNAWAGAVEDRLRALGASEVAFASSLPLQSRELDSTTFADVLSRRDPPENRPNGRRRLVSEGFFSAMGIPLVRGRAFSAADAADSQPVAIVNEAFVRRFLSARDPLREQLGALATKRVGNRFEPVPTQIIGVVKDVRYASVTTAAEPTIYRPMQQSFTTRWAIVVNMRGHDPQQYVPQIRAALREVDASVPAEFSTLHDRIAPALSHQRLGMMSMSAFGLAALLLAMVGAFGVVAYGVAHRQQEMAIRVALGATGSRLFWMVLGESARTILAGAAFGTLLSLWLGAAMSRYVYQVNATDAGVLIGSVTVVAAAALLASSLPVGRLARASR
jgi:putative ABC transport system permease protein